MKLFVAVSFALILICHALTEQKSCCKKVKKCEKIEGVICGEVTERGPICTNVPPCVFYKACCAGVAKLNHFGECSPKDICTKVAEPAPTSQTNKAKRKSWPKRLFSKRASNPV